ncbi:MAG: sialate O-acetylesterase [Pirellulales bacterium]
MRTDWKAGMRRVVRTMTACASLCATLLIGASARGDVKLPNIFSDHMVLQQGQKNKVWGLADAGEAVTVTIGSQSHQATAGANGAWHVFLDPLAVGGAHELTIKGKNEVKFVDVLVGEVWICSGQSNMQWSVNAAYDPDLEKAAAKFPKLRMVNVPQVGTQEPQWNFNGKWQVCSAETVGNFSAVGYFFGRQLHLTLDVPVGLINNAWGGSAAEAWVRRDVLAADEKYKPLLERWAAMEKTYSELSTKANLTEDEKKQLNGLRGQMNGNARPGNIYNGVLFSHIGYGVKGAIWYQGESNASRAYQYRDLFPLMIEHWRKEWNQGDFPFYWVQLADFLAERPQPGDSSWAELREAQTMTMQRVPNSGQAVIIDIGEGKDIHPKNKVDVGRRLARWALAKDYGLKIPYHSPQYKSHEVKDGKVILTFDHVDGGWRPFDVAEPRGFAIAGEDKQFVWASAKILPDGRIEVWSDKVAAPASVRYAWADNPVCNMFSQANLPLTPFRTDDWPGTTANNK